MELSELQFYKNDIQDNKTFNILLNSNVVDETPISKITINRCSKCNSIITNENICKFCNTQHNFKNISKINRNTKIILNDNINKEKQSITVFCIECSSGMRNRFETVKSILMKYLELFKNIIKMEINFIYGEVAMKKNLNLKLING